MLTPVYTPTGGGGVGSKSRKCILRWVRISDFYGMCLGIGIGKGLGVSSLVYATGHIKGPVPLIGKRRGLSPGGRVPPNVIQVISITGLNLQVI